MQKGNCGTLPARDRKTGRVNAIIETPKGSRNKYKYAPEMNLFELHRVLPRGSAFPFDFGFIPSTVGADGDPIDVLLLMEEPVFTGCLVPARLIGVIEAEQTEDGKTIRNDRLIAIAGPCEDQVDIKSIKQLSSRTLDEIEHFFISYDQMANKKFDPIGRRGPNRAARLLKRSEKRLQQSHLHAAGSRNGAKAKR